MAETNESNWLTSQEQRSWRSLLLGMARLNERMQDDLSSRNLTLDDYEVLVALSEAAEWRVRMSDLAELRVASRSRLTHHVGRLESRGLVRRVLCSQDRRGTWAELTPEGFALLDAAAPDHVATVREHLVAMTSPEEFALIGEVFERVLLNLKPGDVERLPSADGQPSDQPTAEFLQSE